jgi:hypothetical protein
MDSNLNQSDAPTPLQSDSGFSSSNNKNEPKKPFAILIKRKSEKTQNELRLSYDTSALERIIENEEEKSNLMKLIKNILLSCNITYFIYATNKLFGYFKSLFFYNLFYFIGINLLMKFVSKKKEKEKEIEIEKPPSLILALLLFNVPELLIIFFYRRQILRKTSKSILFLFSYLNERISYVFNNDPNNNFICQVDQQTYDIYLIKKDPANKNEKQLYFTKEELLSKDTFFDSVIAYPNANFEDFDFNNLSQTEEGLFQNIFDLINDIEKKIKDDNSLYGAIASFMGNLAYNFSTKFKVLYSLGLKLGNFLIEQIYLNNYSLKKQRKSLIEEKTKEFNKKNMASGYFLAINESVILLFRIKEKYKSFVESYNILYNDSQALLKQYFD